MSIRSLLIWGVVAVALVVAFTMFRAPSQMESAIELPYSEMLTRVDAGDIKSARTGADTVVITDAGGERYVVFVPQGAMADTVQRMYAAGVEIVATPARRDGPTISDVLLGLLPMLLLIGAWFFFMRRLQAKGGDGAEGP